METYSSSLENVCKLTTCIEHKWKHGGSEYNYTEEAFRVKEDCEVLGVEEPYVKIKVGDASSFCPKEDFINNIQL